MLRRLWFSASHLIWNCPPGCCTVAESIDPARLPRSASLHDTKREERLCRTSRRSTEGRDRRSGRIGVKSDSKALTSVAVSRMITSFLIYNMIGKRRGPTVNHERYFAPWQRLRRHTDHRACARLPRLWHALKTDEDAATGTVTAAMGVPGCHTYRKRRGNPHLKLHASQYYNFFMQ